MEECIKTEKSKLSLVREDRLSDVGIIGAMEPEVEYIISLLEDKKTEVASGIEFNTGTIFGKKVVVAKCGIGKVFAAVCAQTMILAYSPKIIINTGVCGAVSEKLRPLDIVIASSLVQYDMDTSAIGDEVGLVSGINKVYFDTPFSQMSNLHAAAEGLGEQKYIGIIASGDKFVAEKSEKEYLRTKFGAVACEMEGAAVAHVAYISDTPFLVARCVSDSLNGDVSMEYTEFMPKAAEICAKLVLNFVRDFRA